MVVQILATIRSMGWDHPDGWAAGWIVCGLTPIITALYTIFPLGFFRAFAEYSQLEEAVWGSDRKRGAIRSSSRPVASSGAAASMAIHDIAFEDVARSPLSSQMITNLQEYASRRVEAHTLYSCTSHFLPLLRLYCSIIPCSSLCACVDVWLCRYACPALIDQDGHTSLVIARYLSSQKNSPSVNKNVSRFWKVRPRYEFAIRAPAVAVITAP